MHEVVAEFTSEVEAMFAEMRSTTDDAENMARMQLDSLGLPGSLQVRVVERAPAAARQPRYAPNCNCNCPQLQLPQLSSVDLGACFKMTVLAILRVLLTI